jgi:hypothetical protein
MRLMKLSCVILLLLLALSCSQQEPEDRIEVLWGEPIYLHDEVVLPYTLIRNGMWYKSGDISFDEYSQGIQHTY